MPAYRKIGGSVYLWQRRFVEDPPGSASVYPVERIYRKIGGSLYEYFSSIGMVQDWRITRSTTSTTSYRWNLSYRYFYIVPGVPAVPSMTVYSATSTYDSIIAPAYAGADRANEAADDYIPPPASSPYTGSEITGTSVYNTGPNRWHFRVTYRYFYTAPGIPGTPDQTFYSGTSSTSGSSGSQSGANTALANARSAAIAGRSAPYTDTQFIASSVTQISGSRFVYRARWTALSGDFTQYRIERDGSSDIVLTNTTATSYSFGSSNPRVRIRAENTNYSPAIVGPWSDWEQY